MTEREERQDKRIAALIVLGVLAFLGTLIVLFLLETA